MDYSPPVSPNVDFVFDGGPYTPPDSPNADFIFSDPIPGPPGDPRKSNYMLLIAI